MEKRTFLLSVFLLFFVYLYGQNITVKICKTCGKPLVQCQYRGKHPAIGSSYDVDESSSTSYSSSSNNNISIDRNRVERLISNICMNSSKDGDYNALRDCFTEEIFPHPSGEKRYNYSIGEKTGAYVNRFPQYNISNPYNFTYENTSFPITVRCDVMVNWINTKGVSKQALVHKTYYITSDYKVSGFTDKQENIQ